jgi:hypothetical protein
MRPERPATTLSVRLEAPGWPDDQETTPPNHGNDSDLWGCFNNGVLLESHANNGPTTARRGIVANTEPNETTTERELIILRSYEVQGTPDIDQQ